MPSLLVILGNAFDLDNCSKRQIRNRDTGPCLQSRTISVSPFTLFIHISYFPISYFYFQDASSRPGREKEMIKDKDREES